MALMFPRLARNFARNGYYPTDEATLERARHMKTLVDVGLQSDLMDTVISARLFGLLFFNPPYGDLVGDTEGIKGFTGKGRRRLEKLFYQRCVHLLQYGGVMVMLVPSYTLDDELSGWISQHFDRVSVFWAAVDTYQQVVVFGVRTRRNEMLASDQAKQTRDLNEYSPSNDGPYLLFGTADSTVIIAV